MYRAPVDEIGFSLKHIAGLERAMADGKLGDLSDDVVDAVLEEAGRFATEEWRRSTASATSRARARGRAR